MRTRESDLAKGLRLGRGSANTAKTPLRQGAENGSTGSRALPTDVRWRLCPS
jgi:hypothetical protein